MSGMIKLFVCATLAFACSREPCPYDRDWIIGKWQSLNNRDLVIEYKQNNNFVQYLHKQVFSLGSESGLEEKLCYKVQKLSCNRYSVKVANCSDQVLLYNSEVEVVSDNRIRLYIYKHHHILDLADEYARTNDLESFDTIMNDIMAQPAEE